MRILILMVTLFVAHPLHAEWLTLPFKWKLGETTSEELRQRLKCTSDREEMSTSCTRFTLGEDRLVAHTSNARLLIKLEVFEPARDWKQLGLKRNASMKVVREILNRHKIPFKEVISLVPCPKCKLKDVRRVAVLSFEDGGQFVEMTVNHEDLTGLTYTNMPDGSTRSEQVQMWGNKDDGLVKTTITELY
ncbi:MAG: hypothetical protein OQL20_04550 [Sedimenticola sp.]|nr:hypothetical protein [Sedimenticola sp.]